jgi:hypothetical protein
MSDELEHRLREAGQRLPGPDDTDTAAARSAFLAAPARRRRTSRRAVAFALAAAVAVGGAFGVGYAVAAGGGGEKTKVVHEREALDAGPGFLPADGWDTVSTGTSTPVLAAVAANVRLEPQDRQLTGPPAETAQRLGPNGVLLYAMFGATSPQDRLRQSLLPLQLDRAQPVSGFPGMPQVGSTRRLHVRVAAWDVDVVVFFGSAQPSASVLAAAREELGRLVVPACPTAQPLVAGDVDAAKAFLLAWLPAHYSGDASEVVGARATAAAGAKMPRSGQAAHDCGPVVASQSVEVDVTLPKLAAVSASLSQLTYFLAKTDSGWVVWERAR